MKLYLSSDIEHNLREAISQDNVDGFSRLACSLKWGKPSWSASQLLLQVLDDKEDRLWLWATKLSCDENPFSRRYATVILFRLWEKDKNRAGKILANLADDEHWLVREYAHGIWGELLKKHFKQVFPLLQTWSSNPSANLKRCVAIAVRSAGNLRKEEWAEPLIQLLEPLLSGKNAYVRKNVGPYAIGDGLLRCYPDITLKHLRRWAYRKDEGTRWNVAMAFASYGGNRKWQEGLETLTMLATDKRRYVWRSVASALLYLARRHPEIQNTLKTWMTNPERAKVADTVLKCLKAKKV